MNIIFILVLEKRKLTMYVLFELEKRKLTMNVIFVPLLEKGNLLCASFLY